MPKDGDVPIRFLEGFNGVEPSELGFGESVTHLIKKEEPKKEEEKKEEPAPPIKTPVATKRAVVIATKTDEVDSAASSKNGSSSSSKATGGLSGFMHKVKHGVTHGAEEVANIFHSASPASTHSKRRVASSSVSTQSKKTIVKPAAKIKEVEEEESVVC